VARSTMARLLRWSIELGEGVALFWCSWRRVWRRQRGRAVARLVALFPCLPRLRRIGVSFSGGGGHGSWSWTCLVASWSPGGAQPTARWSRASASEWDGACPVTSVSVHTRDVIGMASPCWARAFRPVSSSSSTRACPSMLSRVWWRCLARWTGWGRKGRGGGAARW
jgi:hypothetical protein